MNQYVEHVAKGSARAPEPPDWALSHGVASFTAREVSRLCGAPANQAPQVFQVATLKNLRNRDFGRSRVWFYARSSASSAPCSQREPAKTGARVATPGATMLMLAAGPGFCGGMSNVATAIVELSEGNPGYADELLATAGLFPDAAARRVGYVLDEFGAGAPDGLRRYCAGLASQPSHLSPAAPKAGVLDREWNVVLNEKVDPGLRLEILGLTGIADVGYDELILPAPDLLYPLHGFYRPRGEAGGFLH